MTFRDLELVFEKQRYELMLTQGLPPLGLFQ